MAPELNAVTLFISFELAVLSREKKSTEVHSDTSNLLDFAHNLYFNILLDLKLTSQNFIAVASGVIVV